jgi:hypothetical protein
MLFKEVLELTASDFQKFPVWEFLSGHEDISETLVQPVLEIPVDSLDGRIVGAYVRLSNGTDVFSMLGNVDTEDPLRTMHFITISFWIDEKWFRLARYFDRDLEERGPDALAASLGLLVDQIFPLSYDLRSLAKEPLKGALAGKVTAEPRERLSREQLIKLAVR